MPMLASARSGLPSIGVGFSGFSLKSVIFIESSTVITPNSLACSIGTSTQATVHSLPRPTWSDSMCE